MNSSTPAALIVLLLFAGACSSPRHSLRAPEAIPALPPVPLVTGALDLTLVYPTAGATKPGADSTFLFGNTGTGKAQLAINGMTVPVAPNGGFLAYLPVSGTYRLVAHAGRQRDTLVYQYRVPVVPAPAVEAFAPRTARVVTGRDTLATGSQIADAAPFPGADRRWFFPTRTRLVVDGKLAGAYVYRVRLSRNTEAWINGAYIAFDDTLAATPPDSIIGAGRIVDAEAFTDVVIGSRFAPFLIMPARNEVRITVYAPAQMPTRGEVGWLSRLDTHATADTSVLTVSLAAPLWGFKAFYDADGNLVVRLRKAPRIHADNPLSGIRILVDAGHPPGGAVGPTALTEAEANLQISLRLAGKLRARGATVLMTRTGPDAMVSNTQAATELWARVDSAVAWNADLLVSVHNNAFPDGVNPFEHYGSETYYFHPFSRPLAEALIAEIAPVTGLPNLGAKARSLALVRPTWMPSTLTESLFMMFPQQEAALRDPAFIDKLADAHLRGIEAFLRESLGR